MPFSDYGGSLITYSGTGSSGGDDTVPKDEIMKAIRELHTLRNNPYACLLYTSPSPRDS